MKKTEKLIIDTIANIQELMVRFPTDADLPMFAAEGKLKLAERQRQRDQSDEAGKLVDQADQIMQDAVKRLSVIDDPAKRGTAAAAMYFSAAQVAQMQESLVSITAPTAAIATKAVHSKCGRMASAAVRTTTTEGAP